MNETTTVSMELSCCLFSLCVKRTWKRDANTCIVIRAACVWRHNASAVTISPSSATKSHFDWSLVANG